MIAIENIICILHVQCIEKKFAINLLLYRIQRDVNIDKTIYIKFKFVLSDLNIYQNKKKENTHPHTSTKETLLILLTGEGERLELKIWEDIKNKFIL